MPISKRNSNIRLPGLRAPPIYFGCVSDAQLKGKVAAVVLEIDLATWGAQGVGAVFLT